MIYNNEMNALKPTKKLPFEGDSILQATLEQVIERHQIDIVVETGTETGATAEAFGEMVDNVYTVDIENKLDRELPSNVVAHLGDSVEFLDMLLPELCTKGKVLFFLDAHLAPVSTRLLDELFVIATQSCPDVVVVIHDFQVPRHEERGLGFDTYDGVGPLNEDLVRPYLDKIFPGGWSAGYNSDAEGAKRGVGIFCAL